MATYNYPASHRRLEIFALVAGTTMLAITARRVVQNTPAGEAWIAALYLAAGIALADIISGLVHWAADTYGHPTMPIFGNFVRTFREHHSDPQDITRHDFIETNGDVFIFSSPVYFVLLLFVTSPYALSTMFGVFLFSYTNSQIHKWAHTLERPRWLRALQRLHWLLPSEHHQHHHAAPHLTHYCITTGWMNIVLDRLRVFRILERGLAVLGIHPTRDNGAMPTASANASVGATSQNLKSSVAGRS